MVKILPEGLLGLVACHFHKLCTITASSRDVSNLLKSRGYSSSSSSHALTVLTKYGFLDRDINGRYKASSYLIYIGIMGILEEVPLLEKTYYADLKGSDDEYPIS